MGFALALENKPMSILIASTNSQPDMYPMARLGDPFREERYSGD